MACDRCSVREGRPAQLEDRTAAGRSRAVRSGAARRTPALTNLEGPLKIVRVHPDPHAVRDREPTRKAYRQERPHERSDIGDLHHH